ncbi:hypothetical protein ABLE91_10670 [Aquabacter sp. CN5-332]|uniref:hypothetical protein n=1 Tax=Aquabacter sp. CN5-332 TaxID=3156608 RepID=UPI0032B3DBD5
MSKKSGVPKGQPSSNGFLMAFLDPPANEEDELHAWYDLEHVPERAAIEGFHTAERYVCLEGWPRYMAFYDLASRDVMQSEAYRAIAGANFSPWSKRIVQLVRGWLRIDGDQIYPGGVRTGAKGTPLRLAVIRMRGVEAKHVDKLADMVGAFLHDVKGVLQFRLLKSVGGGIAGDIYAVVEFSRPVTLDSLDWERLKLPSGAVDMANLYTRYWRRED